MSRSLLRFQFHLWLLAAAVGCASTAASRDVAPIEVSELKLATLTVQDGADRTLQQLDVNGDGTVNGEDVEVFENLSRSAREELARRGLPRDFGVFYPGPENAEVPVFTRVTHRGGEFNVAGLKKESELHELAVESRWAARQAALAALGAKDATRVRDIGAQWFSSLGTDTHDPSDLCDRLLGLDTQAFDDAKIERVVLLDLDKTVWAGNIIDPFLAVLIEDELVTHDAHPRLKAFLKTVPGIDPSVVDANTPAENARLFRKHTIDETLPKEQRISAKDGFFETVALINGLTREEASRAAKKAIDEGALGMRGIRQEIFDADGCSMAMLIDGLQTAGFEVYLLSATLDFLAFAAADVLGVPRDKTIGSPLEVKDDRYTGEVVLSTYGIKGSVTRAWLPSPPLMVFGDSASSDVPMMLEAYGAAFMMNPGERMLQKDAELAGGRFIALEWPGVIGGP